MSVSLYEGSCTSNQEIARRETVDLLCGMVALRTADDLGDLCTR